MKKLNYILFSILLFCGSFVADPFTSHAGTPIGDTMVWQALRDALNEEGKWLTIDWADGTGPTTTDPVGDGGGPTFTQQPGAPTTVSVGEVTTIVHPLASDGKMFTLVNELLAAGAAGTNTAINYTTEGNYIQEDAANTDFAAGEVSLHEFTGGTATVNPTMTSNTAPSGICTASSTLFANEEWKTFDDDTLTKWVSAGGGGAHWVAYEFSSSQVITNYEVGVPAGFPAAAPKDWTFEGWTGSAWTVLGTETAQTDWADEERRDFVTSPTNTTSYIKYRLNWTDDNGNGQDNLSSLLLQTSEGDGYPIDQAYYVTTGDAVQADTSTWATIDSVDITDTTPGTQTTTLYLISFDDRVTWNHWTGSTWGTSTLGNFQTNGMTAAEVEALTPGNFGATGGFTGGPSSLFDIAVDLKTDDTLVTPSADQITVEFTTVTDFRSGEIGVPVTAWVALASYDKDDIVGNDLRKYIANTGHTASADFVTDIANWDLVGLIPKYSINLLSSTTTEFTHNGPGTSTVFYSVVTPP